MPLHFVLNLVFAEMVKPDQSSIKIQPIHLHIKKKLPKLKYNCIFFFLDKTRFVGENDASILALKRTPVSQLSRN